MCAWETWYKQNFYDSVARAFSISNMKNSKISIVCVNFCNSKLEVLSVMENRHKTRNGCVVQFWVCPIDRSLEFGFGIYFQKKVKGSEKLMRRHEL